MWNTVLSWSVKTTKIISFLLFLTGIVLIIIFVSQESKIGPDRSFSHTARKVSIAFGIIGMIISFLPLLGLIVKFSIRKYKNIEQPNIVIKSLKYFLQWERQTRLIVAWSAISLLVLHIILMIFLINAVQNPTFDIVDKHTNIIHHHSTKTVDLSAYSWNYQNICGLVAIGLIVLMNTNGIIMLLMRKYKFMTNKIKYIGQINLAFGISFLGLVITHLV